VIVAPWAGNARKVGNARINISKVAGIAMRSTALLVCVSMPNGQIPVVNNVIGTSSSS
jgi:hypothetical protein